MTRLYKWKLAICLGCNRPKRLVPLGNDWYCPTCAKEIQWYRRSHAARQGFEAGKPADVAKRLAKAQEREDARLASVERAKRAGAKGPESYGR
jgi:hypothetical protein